MRLEGRGVVAQTTIECIYINTRIILKANCAPDRKAVAVQESRQLCVYMISNGELNRKNIQYVQYKWMEANTKLASLADDLH